MWNEELIEAVWDKAKKCSPENEHKGFRKDQCGAWIKRSAYGDRQNCYGWEIDHITPESKGGSDAISNLRPLHWGNNASRQDDRLTVYVTSEGDHNIYKETGERL
jgi:5-methylcytosine-specific restriction endonuclease McrA